jgi:NAD(P)-dependent dehydrogenase (short-subunit alcohol dehydrogenase family)
MYNQPMLQSNALKGKTIIITGGGTGLGKAMGSYFLTLGANLVITSRKLEVLQKTASEMMEKFGGNVLALQCDVSQYDQVEVMLKQSIDKFGKIDGLLNNAAGNFISPTERLSHRAFKIIIDIVLNGTINCTLALGKYWIDKKETNKVICNIVTTYATTGSAYVVPSACAKAGVQAMTRSLAVEWAKYGIRLNGIAPGPFPTKGAWDRLMPAHLKDTIKLENNNPLKRNGEHQELANLAAYLMSDFAAFMNGEIVTFDGGEWLQGAGQFNLLDALKPEDWDEMEKQIRGAKGS